jgi:acetylglutamate kinase
MIVARRRAGPVDLGYVGQVQDVQPALLHALLEQGFIPVVAPIASGAEGETLNINADHMAGKIAAALRASKLVLLTDVRGVMRDKSRPETLISELTALQARQMIETGLADSGMIPKLEACLEALSGGVARCHIVDGRLPHALLMELFTDYGIGTMVVPGEMPYAAV